VLQHEKRPQSVSFRRLIINIAILLLVPLVIGSIAYRSAYRVVEESSKQLHEAVLEQAANLWSVKYDRIKSIVGAIATNPVICRFAYLSDPYSGDQVYGVIETVDTFRELVLPDEMIEEIYVVYPANGVIIGTNTAYRAERFYPWHLEFEDLSFDQWKRLLGESRDALTVLPSMRVRFFDSPYEDMITIVSPFSYSSTNRAYLVFLLRTDSVVELFAGIDTSKGGWVGILNSRGEAVAVSGDRTQDTDPSSSDDSQRMVTLVAGAAGNWSFESSVPVSTIREGLSDIWRTTGFILAGILGAGVLISGFFGYRLIRPVRLLSQDRDRLTRELESQGPLLTSGFFERLLRGEFSSDAEVDEYLGSLNMSLSGTWYCVALCRVFRDSTDTDSSGGAATLKANRLIVVEAVVRTADETPIYVHNVDTDKVAIVVAGQSADPARARPKMLDIVERTIALLPRSIVELCSWGIGAPCTDLLELAGSAREASTCVEYQEMRHQHRVLFYEDIPSPRRGYSYPSEIENRVMSLARSGNAAELDRLLVGLRHDNLDTRHPESLAARLFADDLLCTVMKILQLNHVKNEAFLEDVEASLDAAAGESPYHRYEVAAELLIAIARECDEQKHKHNVSLSDSIIAYIEERYRDPNLTRSMIAEAFAISEPYVSQFFREQTGETLGAFIQSMRLREARRLLEDNEISVKEVGERVGYAAYATFARAFKRTYGISASDYRDQRVETPHYS